MRTYITPMVLMATVGMCVTSRPVGQTILSTEKAITPLIPGDLRLYVGDGDMQGVVHELKLLLESENLPANVQCGKEAYSARFHLLVDREFLGILTAEEAQELEVLTQWRDAEKNAFYQEVARISGKA